MTNYSENVFIIPLQFETLIMKAVADTGAFSSAMLKKHFDKISRNLYQKPEKTNPPEINVSTAFLHQSPILFTVQLTFKIGHLQFEEQFMVFETLSAILLGSPFFDKNEIIIDAHNRLLQTPEFYFQLNLMHIKGNNKQKRLSSRKKIMLKTKTTYTLSPGEQKSLELIPSEETDAQEQTGLVEPTVKFEKLGLGLTSTLDKLTKNKTTTLLAINTTEIPLHIRLDSPVATFEMHIKSKCLLSNAHKRQQQTKTSQQPKKNYAQNQNNLYAITWRTKIPGTNPIGGN